MFKFFSSFPSIIQLDEMDCAPVCLQIILKYYNVSLNINELKKRCYTTKVGTSFLNLFECSKDIGFDSIALRVELDELGNCPFPFIALLNNNHYVVIYDIVKKYNNVTFYISDPAHGLLTYSYKEFVKLCDFSTTDLNIKSFYLNCLFLDFNPDKFKSNSFNNSKSKSIFHIGSFFVREKSIFLHLILALLGSAIFQFVFPISTQLLVDKGVKENSISIIYIIFVAQLFFVLGKFAIELVRAWFIFYLSTRIGFKLISDFFIKLTKLPISFFDTKLTGDLIQRFKDHQRIEKVITNGSLSSLFSVISICVLAVLLLYYNFYLFVLFLITSLFIFFWINKFMKIRQDIDYKKFSILSKEQSKVIEFINGMQDIKLFNIADLKRIEWESIQSRLFKISLSTFKIEQFQISGTQFIFAIVGCIVTFLCSYFVLQDVFTFGELLALTFLFGQLTNPIFQLVSFSREFQDAKISFERIEEINCLPNEFNPDFFPSNFTSCGIFFDNVSFKYFGSNDYVLKDFSMHIPEGKVSAIVGSSGSGKSTIFKLILKYYDLDEGEISINNSSNKFLLSSISTDYWRASLGVVSQTGFIFNESILYNIVLDMSVFNKSDFDNAVYISNILEFVESLPFSFDTKIGNEGVSLSGGQIQRILIARALYRNPKILLFDEATSALDTLNEKIIVNRLKSFFKGKTVILIAHRLSTIKNADCIFVLDSGQLVEFGSHSLLVNRKGYYQKLIENQII